MQLAGASCAICQQNVLVDSDATWCARCLTVIHRRCLAASNEICPTCHTAYDRPEVHFVFSRQCPECFRANDPPGAQCGSCATRTRWDTQTAYDDFMAHMKDAARVCFLRGIAELVGSAVCLLALFAMLYVSSRPSFIGLSLFLLGFMTLTVDGLTSLMRSRRIARFR